MKKNLLPFELTSKKTNYALVILLFIFNMKDWKLFYVFDRIKGLLIQRYIEYNHNFVSNASKHFSVYKTNMAFTYTF